MACEVQYATESGNRQQYNHVCIQWIYIRYDIPNNMIEVTPLEPYTEGLFYFLNITTKVRSKGGQRLKEPVKIKFKL